MGIHNSMLATRAAQKGDFEQMKDLFPNKVLWANDEYRMLIVRHSTGRHLPAGVLRTSNYIVAYDPDLVEFVVIKSRCGDMKGVISRLAEIFQIHSFVEKDGTIQVTDAHDLTILKLKGIS